MVAASAPAAGNAAVTAEPLMKSLRLSPEVRENGCPFDSLIGRDCIARCADERGTRTTRSGNLIRAMTFLKGARRAQPGIRLTERELQPANEELQSRNEELK
jgi:hypothetical protein